MRQILLLAIGILFLSCGQDRASLTEQKRIHTIDSTFTKLFNDGEFNGNILVAEKGKVIFEKSFGLANELTKEKLNSNSVFDLSALSGQFTAMAIVILKEQGKLTYDDKMSKYIPELSYYGNITVRNLLNQTSGLPPYYPLLDSLFDKKNIATNKDVIELYAKHRPKILFEPNTKCKGGEVGYVMLASIIEKVSGKTYAEFLSESIFKPLKMNNSFVYTRRLTPKKIDNYAYGYIYSPVLEKNILPDSIKSLKYVIWLDGIVGDGGVNSTTADLLKWDRALYTTALVSEACLKEIYTPATLLNQTKTNYGFGWNIENTENSGKIVWHDGSWPGYVSHIERHLDDDKTIIILQNKDNGYIPIIGYTLLF